MNILEKFYPVIIIFAVFVGVGFGQNTVMGAYADLVILPLLMVMLFMTFLQIPVQDIKRSFANQKYYFFLY